jgi:hypothetical protein
MPRTLSTRTRPTKETPASICYLCGLPIAKDSSVDHIPPKQFYAPELRARHNLSRLLTLPAHGACNKAFQSDEEYFAWSLGPLAAGTVAADALVRYQTAKFRAGGSQGLGRTVLSEFETRPSGLHLPPGVVVKRVQGERLVRVAWKIVRGLYHHENASSLPDDTPKTMEFVEPERARQLAGTNAVWELVKAQDPRGSYGGIFEYKYLARDIEPGRLHCWGMLFWNKIMVFVAHHDPSIEGAQGGGTAK